jgi:hypothetical protein
MRMLNGRLYRAAFVPFLFALGIAAFSLGSRPLPLSSTLAPDAFEGAPAYTELRRLVAEYPRRRPGSHGDQSLARHVAEVLEGLGGTAGGGFSVRTYHFDAQTIDGERSLSTVVAQRPGSTSATPILILAHRDAAAAGSAAELSGTAALLELARVFAARETKRTIVLASTSGGSGGDAGATQLLSDLSKIGLHGPFDAAIALGDLASTQARPPFVVPFSDGLGSAPLQLQRTVGEAITQAVGVNPGAPSTLGQLAHLAFPLTVGEQGVLDAAGIPAVLVQVSGERGPPIAPTQLASTTGNGHGRARGDALSMERMEDFGRAVLSAVDALDTAPDITQTPQTSVLLQRKTMPAWALRLLVLTLMLAPLGAALDGLARAHRRRLPTGRWTLWTLSCALPFCSCAVFAYVLGWLGVLGAAPAAPVLPGALPLGGRAVTAVVAVALTFALAWLLWAVLMRRLGWGTRPNPEVAGLSLLLVLLAIDAVVWVANPFTALLALPAVHLWLLLAAPELRPRRPLALGLVALGLLPLALLIVFYARQLGLGLGDVAWMGVLLLAGGHVGLGAAIMWSFAFGVAGAAAILAVRSPPQPAGTQATDGTEVTIRGPLSYAGPGSLGGTESALRR